MIETLATIAVLSATVLSVLRAGIWADLVYWAVAAGISSLMPVWAAYLPHRLAPENPVVRAGGRLAQTWTPILTSVSFHHAHHCFPKVPAALLPAVARTNPPMTAESGPVSR